MELAATLAILPAIAMLVALSAAGVMFKTANGRAMNHRLGMVFLAEGALQLVGLADTLATRVSEVPSPWYTELTGAVVAATMAALYFHFLATLETPLVSWLRTRWAQTLLFLPPLAAVVGSLAVWRLGRGNAADSVAGGVVLLAIVGAAAFGLVASISAFRRAPLGSAGRPRAKAFAIAFGVRDGLWAIHLAASLLLFEVLKFSDHAGTIWWTTVVPAITLIYVPLLAYGVLKTQLFDIDLRIKVGIRRSTVVTAVLLVALAAAKVAEFYLNRTFGWIAGGIAAGVMLVLTPRLNKMGEKVASTALPKVENTSAYVEFRKLEVYKAAVESALETGELTDKDRETLRRLRTKLAINEADAAALEGDVRERLVPA